MNASELARKTRENIQSRGWTQYIAENQDGEVCLMGALNLVLYDTAHPNFNQINPGGQIDTRREILTYEIEKKVGAEVADFNDLTSTSYEDVILLLKEIEYS